MNDKPRILAFDIEIAPIISYIWALGKQYVGVEQVKEDWYILAWAAKWVGDPASKTIYRRVKTLGNDKDIVKELAALLEQADGILTQNGASFDVKKVNARAAIHKLPVIRTPSHTDLLKEDRKVFKFTSHKLSYVTNTLNVKYKKLDHREYPGIELWKAILAGDKRAWACMQKYCIHDVLSTEETYLILRKWIKDPALYGKEKCRHCGGRTFMSLGIRALKSEKYRRLNCKQCGNPHKGPL